MKICIYGAGAIGGYLGVELALAGEDVTLIARGPHLRAMQENGLKLLTGDEEKIAHPRCTDDPLDGGLRAYRWPTFHSSASDTTTPRGFALASSTNPWL